MGDDAVGRRQRRGIDTGGAGDEQGDLADVAVQIEPVGARVGPGDVAESRVERAGHRPPVAGLELLAPRPQRRGRAVASPQGEGPQVDAVVGGGVELGERATPAPPVDDRLRQGMGGVDLADLGEQPRVLQGDVRVVPRQAAAGLLALDGQGDGVLDSSGPLPPEEVAVVTQQQRERNPAELAPVGVVVDPLDRARARFGRFGDAGEGAVPRRPRRSVLERQQGVDDPGDAVAVAAPGKPQRVPGARRDEVHRPGGHALVVEGARWVPEQPGSGVEQRVRPGRQPGVELDEAVSHPRSAATRRRRQRASSRRRGRRARARGSGRSSPCPRRSSWVRGTGRRR